MLEIKLENALENKKGRWQAFGPAVQHGMIVRASQRPNMAQGQGARGRRQFCREAPELRGNSMTTMCTVPISSGFATKSQNSPVFTSGWSPMPPRVSTQ